MNDNNSLGTILSPVVIEDEGLMVYDHKNLQIMNCSDYESGCSGVFKEISSKIEDFYGRSQYKRFRNTSYYISFSTIQYDIPFVTESLDLCEITRPVLTILIETPVKDTTSFRLIYSTNIINFNGTLFENPLSNKNYSFFDDCHHAQILSIESIINFDYSNDTVDVLANVNDRVNFVLKLNGLIKLVDSVIHLDQKFNTDSNGLCVSYFTIDYSDENKILINNVNKIHKRKKSSRKSRKEKREERKSKRRGS